MATQIDFSLNGKTINGPLLDQELAAALGAQFNGKATRPDSITVNFTTDASQSDQTTVQNVITAHNSSNQTAQQAKDAANDAAIASLRTAIDTEIAHFSAIKAADLSSNAIVIAEFVRLAHDVAALTQLLERRLL